MVVAVPAQSEALAVHLEAARSRALAAEFGSCLRSLLQNSERRIFRHGFNFLDGLPSKASGFPEGGSGRLGNGSLIWSSLIRVFQDAVHRLLSLEVHLLIFLRSSFSRSFPFYLAIRGSLVACSLPRALVELTSVFILVLKRRPKVCVKGLDILKGLIALLVPIVLVVVHCNVDWHLVSKLAFSSVWWSVA